MKLSTTIITIAVIAMIIALVSAQSEKEIYEAKLRECKAQGCPFQPWPTFVYTPYPPGHCACKGQLFDEDEAVPAPPQLQHRVLNKLAQVIALDEDASIESLTEQQCAAKGFFWVPTYGPSCPMCKDLRFKGYQCSQINSKPLF